MNRFSIESLKVYETPPLILRALQLAEGWLTWAADNTDGVRSLPGRTWSFDYATSSRMFAFYRDEQTQSVCLVIIDPTIHTLSHPLESALAWFPVIPWTLRKYAGSSQLELTFDAYAYNDSIEFPRIRILLRGYPPVLNVVDAISALKKKGKNGVLRFAAGNAEEVPLMGWTANV